MAKRAMTWMRWHWRSLGIVSAAVFTAFAMGCGAYFYVESQPVQTTPAVAVDTRAPEVEQILPKSRTQVDLQFNEALVEAPVPTDHFAVSGARVTAAELVGEDTVRLTLDERQIAGRAYSLSVDEGAVADTAGNLNLESNMRFAGFGASGGVLTVTHGGGKARPTDAAVGERKEAVVVDQLALTASGGDVVVSQLRVRGLTTGTSLFSDLVEAWIFEDNGDGLFQANSIDRQLHVSVPFQGTAPGSPATFSNLQYRILSGETKTVWVVFRVGNLAPLGRYLGSVIKPGDIELAAGTLAGHSKIVSGNGGRTIYVAEKPNAFAKGRVVDPRTVIVTLADPVPGSAVTPGSFSVNNGSVDEAELGSDGRTVRLLTTRPLNTKTVTVDYKPGGDVPDDVGVVASWGGPAASPTYQSAADTLPPAVPGGVSASAGTTAPVIATVSWSASTGDQGGGVVAGYRVWRATSANGYYRSIATTPASPFQDTSGVPDQAYFYKISAYDNSGNESTVSAPSGSITATWTQQPHATYGGGNLCALCHSSHNAATKDGILRSIPGGTTGTALCYQCHDGSGASTNVKTGATDSFALASGHTLESLVDTTNVDLTNTCNDCHGPHQDRTGRPTLWRSVINGKTVTGNNNTWCHACHDSKHAWYKPGEAAYDSLLASPTINATGYPTLGTYPGADVATDSAKNAHATVTEAGQSEPFACLACHDNHRGSAPQDMLLYALRPSVATTSGTVQNERQSGAYAQMCLRCHDGSVGGATNIKQHVTADYADATAYAGHRVLSPGATQPQGSSLPCYECHNVHGSGRGNNSNISDARGASLTTTEGATAEQVRQFCLTCHSTSDGFVWDGKTSAYRSVRTTETIVGLRRDGGTFGSGPAADEYNWLKLKAVDGHSNIAADKLKSCYRCHGDKYDAGRNNVHNPGPGESAGALSCAQCHDVTYNAMRTSTSYHHYMTGDAATAVTIADPSTITTTDSRRTCLTCHADHDVFNPSLNPANTNGRAANLRSSISTAVSPADTTTYINTDFDPLSGVSVCTSCHKVGLTKNTTNRRTATDRSTATIKVTSPAYKASAHNYQSLTATYVSDGSAFKPNCAKCHDDRTSSEYLDVRQVASHDDTRPAVLTDFGLNGIGEDPREAFCFACHSRATDSAAVTPSNPNGGAAYTTTTGMKDVAGVRSMDATAVNIKGEFTAAGIVSSHPVTATVGARVECANCHSVHTAGEPDAIVTNPDNTLNAVADGSAIQFYTRWYTESNKPLAARTNRDFCLKCHDGAAPVASGNNATTYVPYDVTVPVDQSATWNPTRRTNNKDDYQTRSHYNTTGQQAATAKAIDATCADCHDRHGSTLPSLIGVPNRTGAQNFLGSRYVYDLSGAGSVVTGNDNSVCYACHTSATSGYGGNESRTASGYPMTGRFPGSAVATVAFSAVTHLGNPHKSAETQWPGREGDYAAGDCKNCHDPHGTANLYDELRTENAAGVEGQFTYSAGSQTFCFNCHDGAPGRDIKQFYPVSSGGTGVDDYAGHKIRSASASLPVGAGLPCYDCHNSHGSASPYGLQVRNLGTAGQAFDLSTLAGVRNFCFACHVSSDGLGRVNAGMVAISAGTQYVEGVDRTTGGLKLPPLAVPYIGHASGDAKSCYDCHGDRDYSAGGHNAHNPEITAITLDCYGCHAGAQYKDMDQASGADVNTYHHVLGDAGVQADLNYGVSNSYPTSTSTLQCVSCHTGHEYFDGTRGLGGTNAAGNLRVAISDPAGTSRTNSDYSTSGSNGICISCHTSRLAKDSTNQRSDGTTWSPAITNTSFGTSAHQYSVNATVTSDSSALKPNCSKCHNSQITSTYTTPDAGFGVHTSSERNLVSALGTALTDPSSATHCLRCHSRTADAVGGTKKTVAGRDWYGSAGATMSATAEKIFGAFNRAGGSSHPVVPTATGSLLCENCHNPHAVKSSTPVTKPSNNYTIAAYSTGTEKTAYCFECHGSSAPKYVSTVSTYVAGDVTMTAPWANKKTLEGGSHWVPNGSIQSSTVASCADCHDKHGSRYEKLVGVYDPATDSATVKGAAITGNDETVCYACHASAGLGYPTGVATTATVGEWDSLAYRPFGGYVSPSPSATRTAVMWPGQAVYATSPHGSNAWTAPATLMGGPAKDCNTCHDVHGTAETYDELRLPYEAGDYTLCFECHEGSYSSSANIKRYYPAGGNFGDNAGHRVKTAGGTYAVGTPLPCWECHMTHGSTDGNVALLSDARWNGLSDLTVNDADCREFCLGCHTTEDRYRFSSADATMIPVPASDTANKIAGLPRSPVSATGNKLILPHLQTGGAHLKTGTEPCYECHGEDYSGASTANVHNPSSGVSSGSSGCYNCHTAYLEMEDDIDGGRGKTGGAAGNKTVYHHVLGSASDDGDKAPGAGAYPTSKDEVYCVSCHTDHNNFNTTKHANLRASVNSADGAAKASADFSTTGDNGICVSCHVNARAKDTVAQKDDGTTTVPKVTGQSYTGSAHQYVAQSYYDSAATSFDANCSKCHDDSFNYEQDSAMPNRFGTHLSGDRKMVGPLGDASGADPLSEKNCYRCHSVMADGVGGTVKPLDGKDWYGGRNMTAVSQTTFDAFQLSGSTHPVDPNGNGSYVECGNCHNVHVVSATTPTVDPNNTYNGMTWNTANKTAFCLRCHDADHGPAGTTTDASFVPTSVVMVGADLALMDKSTDSARGHSIASATGAIKSGEEQTCVRCHDKHGSDYDKLLGVYTGSGMAINSQPIAGNDESVCYACHAGASTYATTAPVRSAGGYIEEGTWLGQGTWERGYNATEHTGSPHAQPTMVWQGTGVSAAGGDCKQCHDVHGTANAKDMLRTTYGGGVTFSETNFSFCFTCHNGTVAGVSNIATYYPVLSGGTSGDTRAGHRSSGAMPCYDCHNPHGTGDSAYSLMVTAKTGPASTVVLGDDPNEIRLRTSMDAASYAVALREFCFACHTTGDTTQGWAGTAGYQVVVAGTTFEGVDRTLEAGKLKLPNIGGHGVGDAQSCYLCHGGTGEKNVHNLGTGMAEHLATTSGYDNATVTGCVGAGDGCHGTSNDLTVVHKMEATCGASSKTGVVNCHSVDGVSADLANEYDSVRPGRTDGGRTAPNMDCADCHDGFYADTYDRIGLADIFPVGHYSEPTHTADATHTTGVVNAPSAGTASATCTDCHNPGTAGTGRGLHLQHQGILLTAGNPDGNLTCKDCHSYNAAVSQVVTTSAFSAGGVAGKVCIDCHSASVLGATDADLVKHGSVAPSVVGTSTSQAGCGDSGAGCHGTGNWDLHYLHRGDGVGAEPTCGGATGCHDYTKQGAKPVKDCDTCHVDYGTSGHFDAEVHRATSGMADDLDGAFTNANGAECSDCHSDYLGTSGSSGTAHYAAPTITTCASCHNDTAPNSVLVIKTNSWTPESCDNCHQTNNNGYSAGRHDTYSLASHTSDPFQANNCANGTGCHGNTGNDLRRLHDGAASGNSSNPGCTAMGTGNMGVAFGIGCHTLNGRPTRKTCGGDGPGGLVDGECHTTYQDGNHSTADPVKHIAVASASISTSQITSVSAMGNGCGKCHQDGETSYTGANTAITDLDSVGVTSSLHDNDPLLGTSGCGVCHGNARLGGGALGSAGYRAECSYCHTTFKTDYHRSFDASHTTDNSKYSCTMGSCHNLNIIETHRDVKRRTFLNTYTFRASTVASDTSTVYGGKPIGTVTVPVKEVTFTSNSFSRANAPKLERIRIIYNLAATVAPASAYVTVGTSSTVVATGATQTQSTVGGTYTQYTWDNIDVSSIATSTDIFVKLYIGDAAGGKTGTGSNNNVSVYVGDRNYTEVATDDCDLCHFNSTTRVDRYGALDASEPSLAGIQGKLTGKTSQCDTCHPTYEKAHFQHYASTQSSGCLNGCHTYAPSEVGPALLEPYNLKYQHSKLQTGTSGWGNNTNGITGTIEGGCGLGATGKTCHANDQLPDSAECADCHGPNGLNDTTDHQQVHIFDGSAGAVYPASSVDTTFGVQGCVGACHASSLDWVHSVGIGKANSTNTYLAPNGSTGVLTCGTCHSSTSGATYLMLKGTAAQKQLSAGTLQCTDCHNGVSAAGNASSPHIGAARDANSPLIGNNLVNEFSNTASVGGHRVQPYTNAFTQQFYVNGSSWSRTTGTSFVFNVNISATEGASGANALLRDNVTTGTLVAGGTDLQPTTQIYCNDCHGAFTATGPQGAASQMSNYPGFPADWQTFDAAGWSTGATNPTDWDSLICSRCHDMSLDASASLHRANSGHVKTCTYCHVGIPHAWKRPKLLTKVAKSGVTTGDPYPYQYWPVVTGNGTGLVGWTYTTANSTTAWNKSSNCSSADQNGCTSHGATTNLTP